MLNSYKKALMSHDEKTMRKEAKDDQMMRMDQEKQTHQLVSWTFQPGNENISLRSNWPKDKFPYDILPTQAPWQPS